MISKEKVDVNTQQRFTLVLEEIAQPKHHLNFSVIHTAFATNDAYLPGKSTACPFRY